MGRLGDWEIGARESFTFDRNLVRYLLPVKRDARYEPLRDWP